MSHARFLLLAQRTVDRVTDAATESVTWILAAPNSRTLGRAAEWFNDAVACRMDLLRLRDRHTDLRPVVTVGAEDGQWRWRVSLDGTAVAVSGRGYLRLFDAEFNLQRFLQALPTAEPTAMTRLLPQRVR